MLAEVGIFHILYIDIKMHFVFNSSRAVLEIHRSYGIGSIGNVKWSIAMCLITVFLMVYFSLWKGIKSSGKVSF